MKRTKETQHHEGHHKVPVTWYVAEHSMGLYQANKDRGVAAWLKCCLLVFADSISMSRGIAAPIDLASRAAFVALMTHDGREVDMSATILFQE